ncbi:MAG: Verru_Chthon cassette protein A [Pseudomonadota bacterium]|nr:Verru_Chthon cassette protein A [Pseudomonadota bacterium]
MALVLVLGFLVLMAALVIGFFGSVTRELTGANNYAAGVTLRQLSDVANNVVMGQLLDGTKGRVVPDQGSSPRLTWTSQPGLIRTFNDKGLPHKVFKLYSSNNLVVRLPEDATENYNPITELANEVPQDWYDRRAEFTDLNSPVLVEDEKGQIKPADSSRSFTANYPIVDASAALDPSVEGFAIQNAPTGAATVVPGEDPTKPRNGRSGNPAPMPVRWIYVLRNGALTTPDGGNSGTATWSGSGGAIQAQPSRENPIVGRIALWTDDETSKVNLNTASEGTFWDRPWADTPAERDLAKTMPVQNEFQRFAGHPGATCLSAVFGSILPITPGRPTATQLSAYYNLAPRYLLGGSEGGTREGTSAMTLDGSRLYASLDEFIFAPDRTENHSAVDRSFLEKAKFFLTTNSRSPDVNVFNRPRLSLWPLQLEKAKRNSKDRLIAFCSTANDLPYYFQRHTSYTGDGRLNQIDPPPSSQDVAQVKDWHGVERNQQLYKYLQMLTDAAVPGLGGIFGKNGKYPDDRDQILTQMIDLMRSGVNAYNTALAPNYDFLPTRKLAGYPVPGETQALPLNLSSVNGTRGFGRYSTITQAALVFYTTKFDDQNGNNLQEANELTTAMKAVLVLEPYCPVTGAPSWSPHVRYVVDGLQNLKVDGNTMGFPNPDANENPRNLVTSRVGYSGGGHKTAFMGLQAAFRYYKAGGADENKTLGTSNEETEYPFFSQEIPLKPGMKTFNFTGAPITIRIYGGYDQPAWGKGKPTQLVQTIRIQFTNGTNWPAPELEEPDFNKRIGGDASKYIRAKDTSRGVEARAMAANHGDLRFLAALANVDQRYFSPQSTYNTAGQRHSHSLRTGDGNQSIYLHGARLANQIQTRLVEGVNYPVNPRKEPAAGSGLVAARTYQGRPGDWDNGVGNIEDGAYINKPDEGNAATGGESSYFNRGSFSVEGGTTFSPNRQISSAVAFGSLPTGVITTDKAMRAGKDTPPNGRGWQTLLFCPNPAAGVRQADHDGFGKSAKEKTPPYTEPPDHMLLDLFTMPVVEPYAISEPFSTDGRINLNYQVAPFTYLKRDTGLRAVLRSTKIMAIPKSSVDYKTGANRAFRHDLDLDETLRGFEKRFQENNPFVTASQICDMFLVPRGESFDSTLAWWEDKLLTGDNAREYPYGHIYPRVTTRSNAYTIHVRVQSLKKTPGSSDDWKAWREGRDIVTGEYRGATLIERYIDAGDRTLPDFGSLPIDDPASIDDYYRFRVINTKQFAP